MHDIPKRIIQTGRSSSSLSTLERAAVAGIKLLNPDYEYVFFDDEGVRHFIQDAYPDYREMFEAFEHNIQRYDFFRYLAVFKLGGFYFDLDIFLADSLDDLRSHRSVFPFEHIGFNRHLRKIIDWEIGNYAFGSAPRHPFLGAIIENCIRAQKDRSWLDVVIRSEPWLFRNEAKILCSTGPKLVTRTYVENPILQPGIKILFPEDPYDQGQWYAFGRYGVHLMRNSWHPRRNKLFIKLRNVYADLLRKRYKVKGRL